MAVDVDKTSLMLSIFTECQENSLSHERLLASLTDLYNNIPFSHFAEDFFELCRHSLISSERTVFRERTIDFIVRAVVHISCNAAEREDGAVRNLLLVKMFLFCVKYNECVNPAPRFRCVQLIHKLLEAMGSEACLPVELFDIIQRVLLRRATDVKHSVRVQAVQGLARLQSPTDRECPIIKELLWLSRHDTSPDVRRAAVATIVLTTFTLTVVVERCRDVSDAVRKTAYNILADRSVLRPLSIAKRISILQAGLTDSSPEVRKAAGSLVMAWFLLVEQDPILLLRRLDTEGEPKTSRLCLDYLLPNLDAATLSKVITKWSLDYLDVNHIPKPDCCSVECVFFWRVITSYLLKRQEAIQDVDEVLVDTDKGEVSSQSQISALLECILPSVSNYVDLIVQRVDSLLVLLRADVDYNENVMEAESVLEHVLLLSESLDLSDEFGRRRLFSVVRGWLVCPHVPASLTTSLLQLYFNLEPVVQNRVLQITEMISELLDSAEELQKQSSAPQSAATVGETVISNNPQDVPGTPNTNAIVDKALTHGPKRPLNKARETFLRIKLAELKVKLNEVNESLIDCVRVKDFERATALRDECALLDEERSVLLHELTGVCLPACTPEAVSNPVHCSTTTSVKTEAIEENEEVEDDEEEEEDNDGVAPELRLVRQQIKYLSLLSADVVLKANKMVSITVQKSPPLWSLPPALRSLLSSLILPSIQHTDLAVRNQAILALGLCCTLDLTLTKSYLTLFYGAVKLDHTTVSLTAVNCIIDIFLIFGLQPFLEIAEKFAEVDLDICDLVLPKGGLSNSNHSNTRTSETISLALRLLAPMVELIDCDDADLRTAAGVGVAKLFIFDRVMSGKLLSRLLLLWFNPQTAELPTLSQSLGVFFTDYACSSPERQSCVADAVLPTLTSLIKAPASSSLSEIDPGLVVGLLVRLTDASCLFSNVQQKTTLLDGGNINSNMDNPCHDDLAMRLCNRVLNDPQSAEARLYIRVLGQLHLSSQKPHLYKDLIQMTELMFKKTDRNSHLSLLRFKKNIMNCISASGLAVNDFLPTESLLQPHIPEPTTVAEVIHDTSDEDAENPTVLQRGGSSEHLKNISKSVYTEPIVLIDNLRLPLSSLSIRGKTAFTDKEGKYSQGDDPQVSCESAQNVEVTTPNFTKNLLTMDGVSTRSRVRREPHASMQLDPDRPLQAENQSILPAPSSGRQTVRKVPSQISGELKSNVRRTNKRPSTNRNS